MKPLSSHWADQTAARIVGSRGDKETYVLASGITPSGRVHFGNFREVVTVDLVYRAIRSLGKSARFLYSWDNFDTFRKVPKNVPAGTDMQQYLFQPIARIPDPWGKADNYAEGRMKLFEAELDQVGIKPDYRYQEKLYSTGTYAKGITQALEKKDIIRDVLDKHRSKPLPKEWLPTAVYCSKCQSDKMHEQRYLGEGRYSYTCANCGHREEFAIAESANLKLSWRVDWPMRWHHEQVDFEPGGKDHSSEGGSYDTAKDIVKRVWGTPAPIYLQYDFVGIKGETGKMSSSSGELFALEDVLKVYEPIVVRWLFANQKPNRDFSFAFDEDVIKVHEEFDKAEQIALGPKPEKPGRWPVIRRTYELSWPEWHDRAEQGAEHEGAHGNAAGGTFAPTLPEKPPFRPAFRELSNRLQICDLDIERTRQRFYRDQTEADPLATTTFNERAKRVVYWLEHYAPDSFRYRIASERDTRPLPGDVTGDMVKAFATLHDIIARPEFSELSAKDLHERIYEQAIRANEVAPKEFFATVYQRLIGRDQGPKLASFLLEIGQKRLLSLL